MGRDELRSRIHMRIPMFMHFAADGPGVWLGSRKYFSREELVHEHDFYELVLVRSGFGIHVTERGEYPIIHGNVFLVGPGSAHSYRDMNHLEIINVLYVPERLQFNMLDLRKDPGYRALFGEQTDCSRKFAEGLMLNPNQMAVAERILEELKSEQYQQYPGWMFAMNTGFMQFVLLLSRAAAVENGMEVPFARIGHVLDYINHHDIETLPIAEIANGCGISVRTLERLFVQALHCTPVAYLMERRLLRGAELLLSTDNTISEIALVCGFCDGNHFSKMFNRKFAMPPSEYRRKFAGRHSSSRL